MKENEDIYQFGGVPATAGVGAGDGLLAGFGVAWPLPPPLCEERLANCCCAWIFLRRTLRRDRAPSITTALVSAFTKLGKWNETHA